MSPARRSVALTPDVRFAPDTFVIIAGPCAVESREQLLETAAAVAAAGAHVLRGGAYKPRTSRHSFQGLGAPGLDLLRDAAMRTGLPIVTEVLDPRDVDLVAGAADMVQIGSRSMQNFPLLREVGRLRKPVLLKRGAAATLDEFLKAADYVAGAGNEDIVLCERGIRSFDPSVRNTLDLAAVPALRRACPFPIIVDPSHGTGRADLVAPMALAALAAGADGVMIEVHRDPEAALCDGPQALLPGEFAELVGELRRWAACSGRSLPVPEDAVRREA
ncbi:MAG TPA: 3-deoxy-7-phosphoheptulonate synthase [Planctomycetota bacterium]|nr:3-deoxy-7-phosphoheptulonate synthase [Planctomycetota bacterium]